MLEGIESITTASLSLALDAASLRHQAIAANIANVNTPGFIPMQVNFDTQMEYARKTLDNKGCIDPFALAGVNLQMEAVAQENGQFPAVQLDIETSKLAENSVRYQALIKGLNRHFAILNSAVGDGKK